VTWAMTFYRFVDLADPETECRALRAAAARLGLEGTILLAHEGIKGTLAGPRGVLEAFRAALEARAPFAGIECKFSRAGGADPVFHRLKVRVKPEIVTFGQPGLRPAVRTGEHVDWARWNALLDDPDVVVIDTRNSYEVAVGSFPGALDPGTGAFREFPAFVCERLDPRAQRRVAMFCTGGIRCEKASAWMLERGFEAVYQLDGGILGYLETVPPEENRWQGECFVFDQRVSVDRGLEEGTFELCFACRRPLSEAERESPGYAEGVSCPSCIGAVPDERRAGFVERRRQELLAARRGERHVGAVQERARSH
jgi:UPF0176 protein